MDIRRYFYNVGKEHVIQLLQTTFVNSPLLYKLLFNFFTDERVAVKSKNKNNIISYEHKGLIAGSSFSGFLSNVFLYSVDDWGEKEIQNKHGGVYARYCDDILIGAKSQETLELFKENLLTQLEAFGLEANPKKISYMELAEKSNVDFLGIQISYCNNKLEYDASKETIAKLKKFIKRTMKQERNRIEKKKCSADYALRKYFDCINTHIHKGFIYHSRKFGWSFYVFRCINTIESLRLLNFYICDMARYLATGKHNKSSISRYPKAKLIELGFKSLVDYYNLFRADIQLYMDCVSSEM